MKYCLILPCLLLCFAGLASADANKSTDNIRIILNDWSSQQVASHITGQLLNKLNYSVSYVDSSSALQWFKLKANKADVQMEVWEGTMAKEYQRMREIGAVIDAGTHRATTREEWWYPEYVQALCPKLPDWRALNDCSALFQTPETFPQGRYLGGPWEKPEAIKIRALGLNYKLVRADNGAALGEAIRKAVAEKKPILAFNWTPNWVESKIKGRFVEFPEYAPACETDKSWGFNKNSLWDCGNPRNAWLKKIVRRGFDQQFPCAYSLIQNINFTGSMLSEFSALIDVDGMSLEQASTHWLSNEQTIWTQWLPEGC